MGYHAKNRRVKQSYSSHIFEGIDQFMTEMRMVKVVETYSDILQVLKRYATYLESLKNNKDLTELAIKFKDNATTVELVDNNNHIGFAVFYRNNYTDRVAYITRIAIAPEFRRKGNASMLLEAIRKLSLDNGMELLKLEVDDSNVGAKKLYEHMGFRKESKSKPGHSYWIKHI